MTAPTCRCGRTMALEAHFTIGHEDTDHPGTTLLLTETRAALEQVGAWDADCTLYYCASCDIAEVQFAYEDDEP